MRRSVLSFALVGLTALVGCAGGEPRDAAIDMMHDPAYQPPGQGDLSVTDAPQVEKAPPKPRKARHLLQPNRTEIGKLHATNP